MRRLTVEADGGSRGNPGPAGYGAVVFDGETGECLREVAEPIGRATNNVAEYRGLIAGLTAAAQIDPRADVMVRMDSKLVVEQMSGRWKIKHGDMRTLAMRAGELARGLGRVRYQHIPRERNRHADRLANEAMDAAARGQVWQAPRAQPAEPAARGAPEQPRDPAARGAPEQPRQAVPSAGSSGWLAGRRTVAQLLLVRHGATELSARSVFCGVTDVDLDDTGRSQAERLAERLGGWPGAGTGVAGTVIVTSPRRRARSTAERIAQRLDLEVEVEDGLAECGFGGWEGLTIEQVAGRWPEELAAWRASEQVAPPDGESFADIQRRVDRLRTRLVGRYPGWRIILVSHVTPIKLLVRWAVGAPADALFRLHLDVASLSRVDVLDDGTGLLRVFNDTAHLGAC